MLYTLVPCGIAIRFRPSLFLKRRPPNTSKINKQNTLNGQFWPNLTWRHHFHITQITYKHMQFMHTTWRKGDTTESLIHQTAIIQNCAIWTYSTVHIRQSHGIRRRLGQNSKMWVDYVFVCVCVATVVCTCVVYKCVCLRSMSSIYIAKRKTNKSFYSVSGHSPQTIQPINSEYTRYERDVLEMLKRFLMITQMQNILISYLPLSYIICVENIVMYTST